MHHDRKFRLCVIFACLVWSVCHAGFIPQNTSSIETVTFYVSPDGNDGAVGDRQHPFKTIERAQRAVSANSSIRNVVVELDGGMYRLAKPLRFTAADGGQHGTQVLWQSQSGHQAVIAGSIAVTGWKIFDAAKNIYVADIPRGIDARQIWANGQLSIPGSVELDRSSLGFTETGIVLKSAKYRYLSSLPAQDRLEVHATGWFTNRISPVKQIANGVMTMQQPAWDNNTWGYDTLNAPVGEQTATLRLANSLAFLNAPNRFYIDPRTGKLYYKAEAGITPANQDVELPVLQYLLSVSGSYRQPVRDLHFSGIQFSFTSWNFPSSSQGYADQQSGAFLSGISVTRPKDALQSCRWGCLGFEARRNSWSQMPAAVQVSAATRVVFDHVAFAHLGQVALGIGNNDQANASGIGLGATSIDVRRCEFSDLAGGAIVAGGISPNAHHPVDPLQTNRDIVVINNTIHDISEVYKDNSAILVTYVDGADIVHNDISNAPYDGVDVGWGWGMNDSGGNAVYRAHRAYYDFPDNPAYDVPTVNRSIVVAYNRLHGIKKLFHDGGAIYNLSASPDTLVMENYIYDIPGRTGLYLDEGSRYITMRNNVIDGADIWLLVNTLPDAWPRRATTDNHIVGNWHSTAKLISPESSYNNNQLESNVEVADQQWPAGAQAVMKNAGIQHEPDASH